MQFTLRDIMAAMAVAGLVLVLISLPTVEKRQSSRANSCRNNMRNLSLAIIQYETNRGHFPGYNNDLEPTTRAMPNNDRSWMFVVLPYIDRRATYDRFRSAQTPNAYDAAEKRVPDGISIDFDFIRCTSLPDELNVLGAMSYVVNTGQIDHVASSTRGADFAENGVFHTGVARALDDKIVTISSQYVQDHDGLGMTLMLSENLDARHWSDTAERWTGFTYHHADGLPGAAGAYPRDPLAINVLGGQSRKGVVQNAALGFTRPSSYHPDGVNVAFCDGHVRFISDKISYRIYQALMTPNGAAAVNNATPLGSPFPAGHAATEAVNETQID